MAEEQDELLNQGDLNHDVAGSEAEEIQQESA